MSETTTTVGIEQVICDLQKSTDVIEQLTASKTLLDESGQKDASKNIGEIIAKSKGNLFLKLAGFMNQASLPSDQRSYFKILYDKLYQEYIRENEVLVRMIEDQIRNLSFALQPFLNNPRNQELLTQPCTIIALLREKLDVLFSNEAQAMCIDRRQWGMLMNLHSAVRTGNAFVTEEWGARYFDQTTHDNEREKIRASHVFETIVGFAESAVLHTKGAHERAKTTKPEDLEIAIMHSQKGIDSSFRLRDYTHYLTDATQLRRHLLAEDAILLDELYTSLIKSGGAYEPARQFLEKRAKTAAVPQAEKQPEAVVIVSAQEDIKAMAEPAVEAAADHTEGQKGKAEKKSTKPSRGHPKKQ